MKNLYTLLIVALIATGCSKLSDVPEGQTTVITKTEDPNITQPNPSITVSTNGNVKTVTIVGNFYDFYFDQIYHKADGSIADQSTKPPIRTAYHLNFDTVSIFSYGKQPFTFARTAPYTYSLIYTVDPSNYESNRITLRGPNTNLEKEF